MGILLFRILCGNFPFFEGQQFLDEEAGRRGEGGGGRRGTVVRTISEREGGGEAGVGGRGGGGAGEGLFSLKYAHVACPVPKLKMKWEEVC